MNLTLKIISIIFRVYFKIGIFVSMNIILEETGFIYIMQFLLTTIRIKIGYDYFTIQAAMFSSFLYVDSKI